MSDTEQAALATNGLYNLSDFLPKKPTDVELKVIKEMFEASVDGEPYDPDRWSQYFRPAGLSQQTGDPNKPAVVAAVAVTPAVSDDFDSEPAAALATQAAPAAAASADGASKAQDILAMIRNRQK
jgi:hypothetical protein